jgi:YD repeat-containing protein
MLNYPVETLNILNKNSTDYVRSAKITTYGLISRYNNNYQGIISDFVAPIADYHLTSTVLLPQQTSSGYSDLLFKESDPTVSILSYDNLSYTLAKARYATVDNDVVEQMNISGRLKLRTLYNYDLQGNLASVSKPDYNNQVLTKSYLWGYNNCYPIGEVTNAQPIAYGTSYGEAMYEPFEFNNPGGLWSNGLTFDRSRTHTGSFSALLANTGSTEVNASRLHVNINADTYYLKLSGWVYSNTAGASIALDFKDYSDVSHIERISTTQTSKWVYLEKIIPVYSYYARYNLTLYNAGSGNVWFDDIRICPADALMSTYTYEPGLGITSKADERGQTTIYNFDEIQRLKSITDNNGNLLKQFTYNNKGICSAPVYQAPTLEINCGTVDKKVVNGICETGIKKYTGSVPNENGTYLCTYHYVWSDSSVSVDYTETNSNPCSIELLIYSSTQN